MDAIKIILLFLLTKSCQSQCLVDFINKLNNEHAYYRSTLQEISWNDTVKISSIFNDSAQIMENEENLKKKACNYFATAFGRDCYKGLTRPAFLYCRGNRYTAQGWRMAAKYYEELDDSYTNGEVCIESDRNISTKDLKKVEAAILKYLTDANSIKGLESEELVIFAAKLAVERSEEDKENKLCFRGFNDFKEIMKFSKNERVLKWTWLTWRGMVSRAKESFFMFNNILNIAAKRSGYRDYGAVWREELEMPDIRIKAQNLYAQIKDLYLLVHGVLRFHLREIYGDIVPEKGPIPAHLTGSLWGSNWRVWVDRLLPRNIKIEDGIKKKNWSTLHITYLVEDMYYSLGLYAMTELFWQNSIFERGNNTHLDCHGSAVDMFKKNGDFRILYCAGEEDDFHVLHHEMGHIEYFMSYSHQPTIYRTANPAFHEAIGEAVLLGALVPQHLNRLGIINDTQLYANSKELDDTSTETESIKIETIDSKHTNKDVYDKTNNYNDETTSIYNLDASRNVDEDTENPKSNKQSSEDTEYYDGKSEENINDFRSKIHTKLFDDEDLTIDMILLIQRAFERLPSMTMCLALDEFRWLYWEDGLSDVNGDFWKIIRSLQGIEPPVERGEDYLDALAVYYVNHNIPTISYFLSEFVQHQLFEKMCIASVYGYPTHETRLPETMKLTRCDIYGSKAAGKVLKRVMTDGDSIHWRDILKNSIGEDDITADAFNRYFEPVHKLLKRHVCKYKIPIGW